MTAIQQSLFDEEIDSEEPVHSTSTKSPTVEVRYR